MLFLSLGTAFLIVVFLEKKKLRTATSNLYTSSEEVHAFRSIWLGIVLAMFAALFYYTLETYIRWEVTPVILGFDETLTSAYEIPFPAVSR
jgi:hypothetical protein